MSKLSTQEEKELVSFIKDWLKTHGFTQKDLANELNIKSSRTSEIILKMKELYKNCLLYTSPSPRDATLSRMPSSA